MDSPELIEIVLVEDNPRDAELMIRALKKRNLANNLIHLMDGAQALDFVFCRGKFSDRKGVATPKVMLLDLKLPKVNGLEVLHEIKKHGLMTNMAVVIITSSSEDPDIEMAYKIGVNSYVVKPVDFDAFSEVMSNLGMYWLLINKYPN